MIVLDSSFLIAFHNSRDVHHDQAAGAMNRLLNGKWGRGLLPEYVFLEVATVLAARVGLHVAVEVGDALLEAPELEFVPCSDFSWMRSRSFAGRAAGRSASPMLPSLP